MRFVILRQWTVVAVLGMGTLNGLGTPSMSVAQAVTPDVGKADDGKADELSRKPKTKVAPVYPDMARRMNITGTVKLAVVVSPNGSVKSAKAVGGHPVLVNAAMDAMKHWKFESASTESSGVVEFKFQPQ